jgi:uncharacterized protein with HEPN domain
VKPRAGSPERDALYLEDIVASTALIASYLKGTKLADFTSNMEKADAVSRRLIVIGEAVKSLSEATLRGLREAHPDIQWNDIAKLKDRLTHHYWTIDVAQLWEIARVHVPVLKRAVEPMARAARTSAGKPGRR